MCQVSQRRFRNTRAHTNTGWNPCAPTQETQWSKCGQPLSGPLLAALEIHLCNGRNIWMLNLKLALFKMSFCVFSHPLSFTSVSVLNNLYNNLLQTEFSGMLESNQNADSKCFIKFLTATVNVAQHCNVQCCFGQYSHNKHNKWQSFFTFHQWKKKKIKDCWRLLPFLSCNLNSKQKWQKMAK